jgi:hypothetical protein
LFADREIRGLASDGGVDNTPLSPALAAAATAISASGNTVILVATVLNLPFAVYLMKLFQFTSYLTLINLNFPKNVQEFFSYFSVNIFNFLEVKPVNESGLDCSMKNRFGV